MFLKSEVAVSQSKAQKVILDIITFLIYPSLTKTILLLIQFYLSIFYDWDDFLILT